MPPDADPPDRPPRRTLSVLETLARRIGTCARIAVVCAVLAAGGGDRAGAQGVRVGVRTGPTFGFLNDSAVPFVSADGDTEANTNTRIDLHAGAYAIVPLAGPFGVQAELLYVRKGGHLSRSGEASYRVEQYRLSYVEGQVLGRRDVSLPGPLHLHVVAGLTGERLLSGVARRAIHSDVEVVREEIDLTARNLVRHWDVGALVGVGLGYPIGGSGRLSIDLRYNPGFRSIFTDRARPVGDRASVFGNPPPLSRFPPALRHDVITASLSYTLALDG